jgi:hypothetical protein
MNTLSPMPTGRIDHSPASVEMLQDAERPTTGRTFISPVAGTLVFESRQVSINVYSALTAIDLPSLTVVSPYGIPSEAGVGVPSVTATPTRAQRSSRLLFELKVLATFLREVIAYPRSTSRLIVDSETRTVEVERD